MDGPHNINRSANLSTRRAKPQQPTAYTVPSSSSGVQLVVTTSKQFVLTVTGAAGQSYDIQATQDFMAWTVIGTVTVGANGSFAFTDTNAANFTSRFYRTHETSP
jgi:hypothetical protein